MPYFHIGDSSPSLLESSTMKLKITKKSLLLPLMIVAAMPAGPVKALAQFEVKEVTVEKGEVEIEYNADYHWGNPNRKFAVDGGEIVTDENSVLRQRHSLELGLGLTDAFKIAVGVEWEQERFDDVAGVALVNTFDSLKASSIQGEATLVLVPLKTNGFGLAAYTDIEHAIAAGESDRTHIGPLMTIRQGAWSATANLLLAKEFGGSDPEENSDDRWDFDYAAQIAYQMNDQITLALEGYGAIKRLGSSGSPSDAALAFGDQDQHRIGPVIYYSLTGEASASGPMKLGKSDDEDEEDDDEGPKATMSLGILFGLNDTTADAALKGGVSVEF